MAIAACEQCGRNRVPAVHPPAPLPVAPEPDAFGVLLSPGAQAPFSKIVAGRGRRYVLAAGPEAGFDAREESLFVEAGFVPAKLGARVLRTETAALAALAALNALQGDF